MQRDADRITKLFTRTIRRTVADFVKIGRELNTMKDTRYPYGAFERLFQDHATPLPNPIPFTHRYGTSFMALAKHPILSEAKYYAYLPVAMGTLRELARLESAVVLRAIEDGRIHPLMERSDALALQPSPPRAPRVSVPTAARASAKQAIVAVLQRLWYEHPDEREFLLAEVTAMARVHDLRFPAVMAALTTRGPRMTATHAQAVFGGVVGPWTMRPTKGTMVPLSPPRPTTPRRADDHARPLPDDKLRR